MDINQILTQAENLHRSGKLPDAEARYRDALKQVPGHADALYGLGTLLLQQQQPQKALKYLREAASLLPDVPEFLFNLAMAEEQSGAVAQARQSYVRAAYCARTDHKFLVRICKKMIEEGLAPQALSALQDLGDESASVCYWKARAHGAMGEWKGTLKLLDELTQKFPEDGALWREHSLAAGHLREYDTAIKSYTAYMNKKNVEEQDLLALADLYLMARMPREAKESLQKAFSLGLENAEAYLIAGKCARLEGDYDGLRDNLKKAIARRTTFGNAWQMLSEVSDKSELAALADQCATLEKDERCTDRDRIMLGLAAGQAYEKTANFDQAFLAFERANKGQKEQMERRGIGYRPADIEAEGDKIKSLYPKAVDYATSKKGNTQRPVFILGMPRTGTTLVEKILSCLPGVEAGGENQAMEHVARQFYFELEQDKKLVPSSLTAEKLAQMEASYWHRTPYDSPVVIDKMPHNFRHVGLIRQIFPQARILYMSRDPRDVCLSIYCRLFPDVHSYAVDLESLAHFYAQSERLKTHWKETFPDKVLEVVYEDLVENPVEKTREIAAFCGLDWLPECLDFHKKSDASFTFSELQVRKPINRDGLGRWQRYEEQLQPLFKALEKYDVL